MTQSAVLPTLAEALALPPSIAKLLEVRGLGDVDTARAWLQPSLQALSSPDLFPDMAKAVARLRQAVQDEQPIAIYADRDVDGLSGLSILARTLRTLGGHVIWGSPLQGRGLQRTVLEPLAEKAKVMVLVDCGTGENEQLAWLASQGVDVIVADHHRLSAERPTAFAWVHPGVMDGAGPHAYTPAGCVMAFKLAQGLWLSFLGPNDPERMDYFLFDHLDVLSLGILADRVPLTGENRIFAWHGLRRLANTRKGGLGALLRFFRLTPRSGPVTVREASWQIIPMLNAAGRLGQPQWAVDLLLTEEPWTATACINQLLDLNSQRRTAQQRSLEAFEQMVLEQCAVETDPILIAMADDLEPSVTGLAAQSLARKYGRPIFLFVKQGDNLVGSARGVDDVDLFAWVEEHRQLLVKFGGHEGAVGLTVRMSDFDVFRQRMMEVGQRRAGPACGEVAQAPEVDVTLKEADAAWWEQLQRLEPFGPGFPCPVFRVTGIERIRAATRNRTPVDVAKKKPVVAWLEGDGVQMLGEIEAAAATVLENGAPGPWTITGHPVAARKGEPIFKWIIQEVSKAHG
jgi:single-stranded-DNA-specific exonuclease